jgi:poly(beta-D-mannuronate) lyase
MLRTFLTVGVLLSLTTSVIAQSSGYSGLFDVEGRRLALQTAELAPIRNSCLSIERDPQWPEMEVVTALSATQGYGTDRSGNDFSWAVMVLSGRSLGGDDQATQDLKTLLLNWARNGAFRDVEVIHDAYYALKRVMLPVSIAYAILKPSLSASEDAELVQWIDPLVRKVDHRFEGDVDINNHRDLADSTLMVWGGITSDRTLIEQGIARYKETVAHARSDGSIPLETRRGSRSLWYMRQTLTSLTVMAEVARGQDIDLYQGGDASIWPIFGFLVNGLRNPILVNSYAAQNYIPGPQVDYRITDFGFLDARSNGRHYLASLEAIVGRTQSSFAQDRVAHLFKTHALDERPLIDEFVGGNATCFWGRVWQ